MNNCMAYFVLLIMGVNEIEWEAYSSMVKKLSTSCSVELLNQPSKTSRTQNITT